MTIVKRHILSLALLLVSVSLPTEAVAQLPPKPRQFFKTHCIQCHGKAKQECEFRIDNLSTKVGFEDTPQWVEIMERISAGEMPPEEAKNPPSADEKATIVEWIARSMKEGEAARMAKRDRVSYRRLTREEYVYTMRDLIGVHYDATDPGGLLEDPEWHGFERIGSILTLSPSHVEKYIKAAEVVLAEAYPDQPVEYREASKRAMEVKEGHPHFERLKEKGLLDQVRAPLTTSGEIYRYSNPWRGGLKFPGPGVYEVSYTVCGLKPEDGNAPRTNGSSRIPFITTKYPRAPWQMKITDQQGRPRYPILIIDSLSMRGPIVTKQEQQRRDEYMPNEANIEAVRQGLAALARHAFRRPLYQGELDVYVDIVKTELDAGESFKNAIKTGMVAILCSKSFLFISEGDETADRHQLNDWELATRLSYLLWSTMPDDELFRLAEKGQLRNRKVLQTQFKRMLADPRAERFTRSFSKQWLHLRKVGMFPPDKRIYPNYDDHLEQSMIGETQAFFAEVLHKGLTLREFIDSDWTMVNSRLARFYGIPDIVDDRFQRVTLRAKDHRGGLLTHASVLSLTSDGTRHRPVHRGAYQGDGFASLQSIKPGQRAQMNLTWTTLCGPGRVFHIWFDEKSRKLASARQLERHRNHIRERGVPGWVDAVDDKKQIVTVTFFDGMDRTLFRDFGVIVSEPLGGPTSGGAKNDLAPKGTLAVARRSLMTYDPTNDRKGGNILKTTKRRCVPAAAVFKFKSSADCSWKAIAPARSFASFPLRGSSLPSPRKNNSSAESEIRKRVKIASVFPVAGGEDVRY